MNISDKPTTHILVKARTNSEWDSCDFAIISIAEAWQKEQLARLAAVKPFQNDLSFLSLIFFDGSADFYQSGNDELPDIDELPADKEWVFVDLSEEEQDSLTPPENSLNCYQMKLYKNGKAQYTAYGKHTSEEFWTEDLPLKEILQKIKTT